MNNYFMQNISNEFIYCTSDSDNEDMLNSCFSDYNKCNPKNQDGSFLFSKNHKSKTECKGSLNKLKEENIGCIFYGGGSPMMFSLSFYSNKNEIIGFCEFFDSFSVKNLLKLITQNRITRLYAQNTLYFLLKELKSDFGWLDLVFIEKSIFKDSSYSSLVDFKYKSEVSNSTKCCISALIVCLRGDLQINIKMNIKINQFFLDDKLYMPYKIPHTLDLISKTKRKESLFDKINYTKTKLGSNFLKMNLVQPYYNEDDIKERHNILGYFMKHQNLKKSISKIFKRIPYVQDVLISPHFNENPSVENYKLCIKKHMKLSVFLWCCNDIKDLINDDLNIFKEFKEELQISSCKKLSDEIMNSFNEQCALSKKKLVQQEEIVKYVKSGINDYLDLARKIYFEVLEDLTDALHKFNEKYDFKVVYHETEGMVYKVSNSDVINKNLNNFIRGETILENLEYDQRSRIISKNLIENDLSEIVKDQLNFQKGIRSSNEDEKLKYSFNEMSEMSYSKNLDMEESFFLISTDKGFSLITTAKIRNLNNKLRETYFQILEIEGKYCLSFLQNNYKDIKGLLHLSEIISEIDVCLSISFYASKFKCCIPSYNNFISIKNSYHPLLEHDRVLQNDYYSCPYLRFNIVTGPNMSGKTTYIKQLAYIIILNQIGYPITAEVGTMKFYNKLYIKLNVSSMHFNNERMRLNDFNEIMRYADSNTMILIDEIGKDFDSNFMIRYFITVSKILLFRNSFVYFITHQYEIIDYLKDNENINVLRNINYKVKSGVSKINAGIEICKELFPTTVMNEIIYFYNKIDTDNKKLDFKNSRVRLALRIENCKSTEEKNEILEYIKKRIYKQ